MTDTSKISDPASPEKLTLDNAKQNIANKKIYFDADGTEIRIGYDDQTGVGFVEIVSE